MNKNLLHNKMIGKLLMAFVIIFVAIMFAYMGVYALKKAMSININFPVHPSVRCELFVTQPNGTEQRVFSNLENDTFIHPDWSINPDTSTLSYSPNIASSLGNYYSMRVLNYTNTMVFVETVGEGTSYNTIALDAYVSQVDNSNNVIAVSTVSNNYTINFKQVYQVTANLTNTSFDMQYANNTLLKCGDIYYITIGDNLQAKIINKGGYDFVDNGLSSLSINGTNVSTSTYFSNQLLSINSGDVTGNISLTSTANLDYWDGTSASAFAGGNGTELSPYLISTPEQFAKLASDVNGGNYYEGTYFEMTSDLYLSNYIFTFDNDSGLVAVTNTITGQGVCAIGTKVPGFKYYNTYETASMCGTFYNYSDLVDGTLNTTTFTGPTQWVPIVNTAHSDLCGMVGFQGYFNGHNHTIYNAYMNNNNSVYSMALFGKISNNAIIKNLIFKDSFVLGNCATHNHSAGICAASLNSLINNCKNYSTIIAVGSAQVRILSAGILGWGWDNNLTINNENYGTIISYQASSYTNSQCNAAGCIGTNVGGYCYNNFNAGNVYSISESTSNSSIHAGGVIMDLGVGTAYSYNLANIGIAFAKKISNTMAYYSAHGISAIDQIKTYGRSHNLLTISNVANIDNIINNGNIISDGTSTEIDTPTYFTNTNPGFGNTPNCTDESKIAMLNSLNDYVDDNPTVTLNSKTYSLNHWTRDTNNIINRGFPHMFQ